MFGISHIIREKLKPIYLFIYRFIAFFAITGSLMFLIGWAWIMIFFMFNNTWIAPTFLSASSDKMLQFTVAYQQAEQNLAALIIARDQAVRDYQAAEATHERLSALETEVKNYSASLQKTAPAKEKQVQSQQALIKDLDTVEAQARKNAKLGLISNDILVSTLSSIAQFRAVTTDAKTTWDTTTITARGNLTQLSTQLYQAQNDIATKKATIDAANESVSIAEKSMSLLKGSAYMQVFNNNGGNLVFVGYSNLSKVKVGSPIYDCYLTIIACHKVGTIKQIYNDEQIIDFPLFNIRLSHTVRGVFAEAVMDHPEAMHSSILFVGGKPLFL